jgi:hypothetical protein
MGEPMSGSDPAPEQEYGSRNAFVRYGWLSVYYREAASAAGFQAKDDTERWELLRNRVLLGPPKDDGLRQRAIDAIPQGMRSRILAWLQSREHSGM